MCLRFTTTTRQETAGTVAQLPRQMQTEGEKQREREGPAEINSLNQLKVVNWFSNLAKLVKLISFNLLDFEDLNFLKGFVSRINIFQ